MQINVQKLAHSKWNPAHYYIYKKLSFSRSELGKECVGNMHFGVGLFYLSKKCLPKIGSFLKAYR